MRRGSRLTATLALTLAAPCAVRAQTNVPTPPPPDPPIRRIESAAPVSTEPFGAITSVRALADGRVLVNDGTRRRLLLMDSALIPYRGDSTLFVDAATYAMLVIDPAGKIARVRSVPRAQDVNWYANPNGSTGLPGIDARGRLVYRIPAQPARPTVPPPPNVPYIPSPPDSAFVVGIHLDTRRVDTLAAVRTTRVVTTVRQTSNGINVFQTANPLPLLDDWAVLPDGTVALVRGRDYRIEWLDSAGALTSSEKLPFPWVRLTDDDKTRFVDSITTQQTRNAQNNFTTQMIVWSNLLNKPYPARFTPAPNYVPQPGFPRDWILPKGVAFPAKYTYGCPPGVAPSGPGRAPDDSAPPCIANPYGDYYTGGYQPPAPTYRPPSIVRPSELPDYRPPFAANAVRADAEGNLWIRTLPMKPTPGGPVYDVVTRAGRLVDRVQLPSGYTLVGFGRGNTVYLSTRDAKGLHLARVRLRQVGA